MTPALELLGITKRFGSVVALDGADFVLGRGEIHGLLGENGAGKSTLMHVAFGLVRPDSGTVKVNGLEQPIRSPEAARRAGLGMVHQHFTSIPALTVRENLWLAAGRVGATTGAPPTDGDTGPAAQLRRRLWAGLDPSAAVESLPVGAKQRLELLQALSTGASVLLLDEPTAVLTPPETEELLALLREFAAAGGSAVLITHKLGEVLAAVDRVTVLRRGRVTFQGAVAGQTAQSLAAAMVGGAEAGTALVARRAPAGGPEVVVSAGNLVVRAGEIVGIAAVEGNGQRELLQSIAGVARRPAELGVADPVAFIPEDRITEGLIPAFTLTENVVLGLGTDSRWRRGRWLRWDAADRRTAELLVEFDVRAPGPAVAARTLSGGNQQKLVFARALEASPRVVVAENPTRGLDVHATRFVHDRLRAAADAGAGVLVYSADLDEVLELADRVVVMYRGSISAVEPGSDRDRIGALMLGTAP